MSARTAAVLALYLVATRAAQPQTAATPAQVEGVAGASLWCLGYRSVWGGAAGLGLRLPGEFNQLSVQLQVAFVPSADDGANPGLRTVALELAVSTARQAPDGVAPALAFAVAAGRAYFAYVPPPESPPLNCRTAAACLPTEPPRGHWRWLLMPTLGVLMPIGPRFGLLSSARLMIPRGDPNDDAARLRLDVGVLWRP